MSRARLIKSLLALSLCVGAGFTPAHGGSRVQLRLDTDEADQVLAILQIRAAGKEVANEQWRRLFATEGYRRLKARDAAMAKHSSASPPTDEDFKRFVLSDALLERAAALRTTLVHWKRSDWQRTAGRDLDYLPASAVIRATIYPVIKPQTNSFVWGEGSPAIFLYLDPRKSAAKFENTVAHELHHIGLAGAFAAYEQRIGALPERPRAVAYWLEAFGEGFAVLAAAGGPHRDPQAASSAEERARWDRQMADFGTDLHAIDGFFLNVLNGKFADRAAVDRKASSFYGTAQGPWYTVGYRMAVTVEKRFGRQALISTMLDPRRLLVLYNQAAAEENTSAKVKLPLWSVELLEQLNPLPLTLRVVGANRA